MKKRIAILAAMLVVIVVLSGCSGVWMNATYSSLLDRTTALSEETASRAAAGGLSKDDMTTSLVAQAEAWKRFKEIKDANWRIGK